MTTDADLPALPELAARTTAKDSLTVETVPWPIVTRYSGGASHEGVGGRVWIRLSDEGQEVEYVPATPAIAADRERAGSVDARVVDTSHLRGLDTQTRVRFYEHDFYVLSNFSAFTLIWRGIRFDTSEAAYHFEKFSDDGDGALADLRAIQYNIRTAPSAHEAFKIAERNRAHRRPDWDEIKVGVMREILRAKAHQHEYVRRKLLATGDRELVEDSWRDDFWGWGPNRDGQNMLGKLWMEVRAELRTAALDAARSKP